MLTVSKNYFLTHPPKSNSYTTFDPGTQTIIFNTFSHHHRTAEHRTPSTLGLNFTCFTFTVIFDRTFLALTNALLEPPPSTSETQPLIFRGLFGVLQAPLCFPQQWTLGSRHHPFLDT